MSTGVGTGLDIAPTAQRVRWSTLDDEARLRVLQRPGRDGAQALARSVAALIDKVRGGGDDALRAITARLDAALVDADAFTPEAWLDLPDPFPAWGARQVA